MGCDIHGVFQAKQAVEGYEGVCSHWVDIRSDWDQSRHYFLFSWLANVRNGYGFAGVPTYDAIKPITEPRGLPSDFIVDDDEQHLCEVEAKSPWMREQHQLATKNPVPPNTARLEGQYYDTPDDEDFENQWMGDHSHGWLTGEEILNAERPRDILRHGVVERNVYWKWKNSGDANPLDWCGDVTGKDIVKIHEVKLDDDGDDYTHVICSWQSGDDGLEYFVDEVKRLKDIYGEIRLVFGFDN